MVSGEFVSNKARSKYMSKAKWYNPTGNPIWDGYYKVWWTIATPLAALILMIIVAAFYNTYVRHI